MVQPLVKKLECERAVFIAPKVYGYKKNNTPFGDGEQVLKFKVASKDSIKNLIIYNIEDLLIKDAKLHFEQNKWYLQMFSSSISLLDCSL